MLLGQRGQRNSATKITRLYFDIWSRVKHGIESRLGKTAVHMIVICWYIPWAATSGRWATKVSIKLRQGLPGPGINSTRLQKILGVEFGVALEI